MSVFNSSSEPLRALLSGDITSTGPYAETLIQALQFSLDSATDAVLWVEKSAQIVYVNRSACELLGYSQAELLAMTVFDIQSQLTAQEWDTHWRTLRHQCTFITELSQRMQQPSTVPAAMTVHHLQLNQVEYHCIWLRDLSEQRLAAVALQESEARFRRLVEAAADAFFIHNLAGQIVDVNQQACQSLGYTRAELLTLSMADIAETDADDYVWAQLMPGKAVTMIGRQRRKDATSFPVEMRLSAVEVADTTLILALVRDITEQERVKHQLQSYAYYDPLTQLPNRTLFLERLDQLLQTPAIAACLAVLCLHLDRCEAVKYSFGHSVSEELLVAASQRLINALPPSAVVARIGASEFAILLTLPNSEIVLHYANQIQQRFVLPFDLSGHEVFTSIRIGIALNSELYPGGKEFMQAADMAMHRAQTSDVIYPVLFDRQMQAEALQRLRLDTDLRRALQRDELQLCYQPIVSLDDGHVVGLEALVRWHHPQRGLVPPLEFISLAEETGLIVPLGMGVLQQACHQLARWRAQFPLQAPAFISVNLSAIQLEQPDWLEQLDRVLQETGLPPHCLKLEITESTAMKHTVQVMGILSTLRERQVQLSIDDFGTGYSSLSYLHTLPCDTLKIDQSFVTHMEGSKNREVIRTIITLAHTLGMKVVAEGVETMSQLEALQSLHCELGQGYFFAKPMTAETLEVCLASCGSGWYYSLADRKRM